MKRLPITSRYVLLVVALLSASLFASGAIEIALAHRERVAALDAVQREQARVAAATVGNFVETIARSLGWVSVGAPPTATSELDVRRKDFIKLLRMERAITTAALIAPDNRELLRVSRISADRIGSGIDRSGHPGVRAARGGQPHFGDVEFLADTEPYMTIVAPAAAGDGSLGMADVNLKFVWNVITGIRVGASGHAYVVDGRGRLVAHPDITRVLRLSDLSDLPQVREAQASAAEVGVATDARNASGEAVVTAYARIAPLNWTVFVESPRAEALAPMRHSLMRSAVLFGIALLVAAGVGVAAARRMVAPLGALRGGVQRFAEGDLEHRIEVDSGDELQDLAAQFNVMATRLRENQASLEQRVADRTQDLNLRNVELTEALEQQTATAEILRVISASPTGSTEVFRAIVEHTLRLCEANFAAVLLVQDGMLRAAVHTPTSAPFAAYLERGYAIDASTASGRAALTRHTVQVSDILADPQFGVTQSHRDEGVRTVLAVPMLADAGLIGVVIAWRREVRAFSDRQVRLLETFARQAIIAVENVRMFERIERTRRELDLANQAKSRLLAAASHDLRQPMHALALYVDQLNGRLSAPARAALTRRIEEAVRNLADLLDQLLDLSKLEGGAVQPNPRDVALAPLLDAAVAHFAPQARAAGLSLRLRPTDAWVHADPLLVQRILLNLIANALRYTERGGVLVGVRRRGTTVRLEVRDTGWGIPPERRDDIFREFVRLERDDRPRTQGLGLGLAIVARLAELLGTRIELRSEVGRGSLFAFALPCAARQAAAAELPPAPSPSGRLQGATALVIDDDAQARAAMCGQLARWGCATLDAADGAAALRAWRAAAQPPAIVLCDYRLGGGEHGIEVIARLRACAGAPVPAVLVTADTAADTMRAAAAAQIPVLHKPVSPLRLRALLSSLLAADPMRDAA